MKIKLKSWLVGYNNDATICLLDPQNDNIYYEGKISDIPDELKEAEVFCIASKNIEVNIVGKNLKPIKKKEGILDREIEFEDE